jgi:hypothetical protein
LDHVFGSSNSPARGVAQSDDDDKSPKDKRDDDDTEKARKAKKAREAKKAKGEDPDPDDEDEEDEADPKASAARARERARIGAIMSSAAARRDPVTAMHLCVDTATPRAQAIALLGNLADAAADREDATGSAGGRDHLGNPLTAAARRMIAFARGRTGEPSGQSGRRARDVDARGNPVSATAQAMLDAGRKGRGEN